MAFGYNDIIWILSVIAWTVAVTTVILYILKRGNAYLAASFYNVFVFLMQTSYLLYEIA
jgi:hypothetical protein